MRAEIESISGVLRVWEDDKKYGDPYEWTATIRWLNKEDIELLGDTSHITPAIYKAIKKECVRLGIKRALRVAYRDGKRTEHWMT